LIEGGAGTGKTLLAIEAAKKAAAAGEKTALFCYNKFLAAWLKKHFEKLDAGLRPVYVGGFHDFIFEIAEKAGGPVSPPEDAGADFWQTDMPIAGLDAAETLGIKFDRLIIDEAQDLLTENYLELFDYLLANGVERGKWFIFGDFAQQGIFSDKTGEAMKDMLDQRTVFVRFRLRNNCRNTKQIVKEISALTSFDKDVEAIDTEGPPVTFYQWETHEDEKEGVEQLLERLRKEKIPDNKITILAPYRLENSVAATLDTPVQIYTPDAQEVTFSTIQAFKGLENSCIILVDITSYQYAGLIYVALSRARGSLYVFETKSAHKERTARDG
jgi:DNA helicase IV